MTKESNMKLEELQNKLDEKKYLESEIAKQDLSGKMEYCKKCAFCYKRFAQCTLSHQSRLANCVCARAYKAGHKDENV